MSSLSRRVIIGAASLATVSLLVSPAPTPQAAAATSNPLIKNGEFAEGLDAWAAGTAPTRLSITNEGRTGAGARVAGTSSQRLILTDKRDVRGVPKGTSLEASVWLRSTTAKAIVSLSIKEKNGDGREVKTQLFVGSPKSWTRMRVPVTVTKTKARLDFAVRVDGLPVGDSVVVDDAAFVVTNTPSAPTPRPTSPTPAPTPTTLPTKPPAPPKPTAAPTVPAPTTPTVKPTPAPATGTLTNGCTYTSRGIPACGAYVGGAFNSNTDPAAWESTLSKQLGVRRTYFSAGQVNSAVATAKADLAKNRVTWMSFKAPHSWHDMAAGKGDVWARDAATKLAALDGPVWVAIHHEPENDGGDIAQWTAMQARMAPIFRNAGSNIAYSIILMGYHQFYGDQKHGLDKIWPKNTTIDIAGFDIYDEYGMTKNGKTVTAHKRFRANYFDKIRAWAKPRGIHWGLAETGFSESSVKNTPDIMSQTYRDLVDTGGIALAYFNTNLNATIDWRLNSAARQKSFAAMHKDSPTIQ